MNENENKNHPTPTGDPWNTKSKELVTVPVPTPVIMVKVEGPFTERERKLWTFLLHAVWDDIEKDRIHKLPVKEINRVFRELGGEHDIKWIEKYLSSLSDTKVTCKGYSEEDGRYTLITHLIAAAKITNKEKEEDFIYFEFPAMLIEVLKEPMRFARLRTHFLIGLSGKYTVTLYELLESIVNRKNPVLMASVDELRQWLKVPEGKLKTWRHLYTRALKPALDEINKKPEEAGFSITIEKIYGKRNKVTHVRFNVHKTKERKTFERKITKPKETNRKLPRFPGEVYEKAKKVAPRLDIYALESQWRNWIVKNEIEVLNSEAHFIDFCKKKSRR